MAAPIAIVQNEKRILVCGDRNWRDYNLIFAVLKSLKSQYPEQKIVIIEGGCRGADKLAGKAAHALGFTVEEYPVTKEDWMTLGKKAGPIRNAQMLKEGRPERVIAFHENIATSRGTANMIRQALKAGLPVELNSSAGCLPIFTI